ncbi:MAG: aminotransferase class I/II-fold pyridoxal phosphate-dependent enzyme [Candidatus Micrarchaeota archaeon]|nr:aminotransferase class I/II-fold pyridoxal phosphate-dependent enzyme [Candidatus Micrarchaeota archaeon]
MAIRLADRVSSISYEIRDIVARARKVQASGKKIHWFNIGDPNQYGFKPPENITNAIIEALHNPKYSGYCPSEGDPELREAIAKIEGISSDYVTIHSGLSEGIDFLFQALVNHGDNVLLPSPSYPLYNTKLKVSGGVDNFYATDENFIPIPEDVRKRINRKTKALVIINPNNPTGATYPRSVLQEMVNIAGEHGLPIVADEIYDRTTIDEEHSVNLRTLSGEIPLISGNGLSKNFIYPGSRVGYLALHGEGIDPLRDALVKLCNQRLSVNWEMQRGALAAYTQPITHLAKLKSDLRKRRDVIYNGLNAIEGIHCAKPTAAFYCFPKIEADCFKDDKEFVYTLLEETGVLVVPGSSFAPNLPGRYFRLVFLAPPEELQEALGKIETFVGKFCRVRKK